MLAEEARRSPLILRQWGLTLRKHHWEMLWARAQEPNPTKLAALCWAAILAAFWYCLPAGFYAYCFSWLPLSVVLGDANSVSESVEYFANII